MNHSFTVSEKLNGSRLDVALKQELPNHTRGYLQKNIRLGACSVDDGIVTDPAIKVHSGQTVTINFQPESSQITPMSGNLEILWKDSAIAVCAKPAGIIVHPCPSCKETTLANLLLGCFPVLREQGGERPGIVHRLDKDTSGLIVIALGREARITLEQDFAGRKIHKEYLALVHGKIPESGDCNEPIGRHPQIKTRMATVPLTHGGKPANTSWRRLLYNAQANFSLIALRIFTGRTHQIRVHLSHLGYPILGDGTYASHKIRDLAPRQMLHAWRLELKHPLTGQHMKFCLPPPEDFFATIVKLSKRTGRIVVTGNQGCGKSSFCSILEQTGIPAISSDTIVGELYNSNSEITDWLKLHFNEKALNAEGNIDKKKLFGLLQSNPMERKEFEELVHTLVYEKIDNFWKKQANSGHPWAVAEIPLFFESHWQKYISPPDLVVGIHASRQTRWSRILASRGWSLDKISQLEQWQWPEEKKMKACDLVIANDGDSRTLKEKALDFIAGLDAKKTGHEQELLEYLQKLCGIEAKVELG